MRGGGAARPGPYNSNTLFYLTEYNNLIQLNIIIIISYFHYLGGFNSGYNDFNSGFSGSNFASGEGSSFGGGRGRGGVRGRGGPVRGISGRGPGNPSRGGRGTFGRGGRGRY